MNAGTTGAPHRHDVAIVGYGPVGQALAALLGSLGHDVLVVERYREIYPLPRAVRLDGEVMLLLQHLGVVDDVAHEVVPGDRYVWFGADGEIVLDIPTTQPHPTGWAMSSMFHQPTLEAALCARAEREHTVTVERGWTVDGLDQVPNGDDDDVDLFARKTELRQSLADRLVDRLSRRLHLRPPNRYRCRRQRQSAKSCGMPGGRGANLDASPAPAG